VLSPDLVLASLAARMKREREVRELGGGGGHVAGASASLSVSWLVSWKKETMRDQECAKEQQRNTSSYSDCSGGSLQQYHAHFHTSG